MLLLASNVVGAKALEILIGHGAQLSYLVLHRSDPGNLNERIQDLYASHLSSTGTQLIFNDDLDGRAIEAIASSAPDIGFLAWWPEIIRDPLLTLPRRGWINFHPSFLPFNRGKHPNFWCLAEGTPCGVSLHFATADVDAGDIVARAEIPVTWEDTGETIYRRSLECIVQLFSEIVENLLRGDVRAVQQPKAEGSMHYASQIDAASRIDLDRAYRARDLLNIIRARMFPPHPTTYFVDGGKKYSVEVIIKEIGESKDG